MVYLRICLSESGKGSMKDKAIKALLLSLVAAVLLAACDSISWHDNYKESGQQINEELAVPDHSPTLVIKIVPEYPILPPDVPQKIKVLAYDSAGRPLSDIIVTLTLRTATKERKVIAPPTNIDGIAWLGLGTVDAACAEVVKLHAVANQVDGNVSAENSFVLWCNPNP